MGHENSKNKNQLVWTSAKLYIKCQKTSSFVSKWNISFTRVFPYSSNIVREPMKKYLPKKCFIWVFKNETKILIILCVLISGLKSYCTDLQKWQTKHIKSFHLNYRHLFYIKQAENSKIQKKKAKLLCIQMEHILVFFILIYLINNEV